MAWQPPFIPDDTERIISIENNGVWVRGGTYTVTWYEYRWFLSVPNPPDPADLYYKYGLVPFYPSGASSGAAYAGYTKLTFSTYSLADDFDSISDNGITKGSYYTSWDSPDLMNNDITFTVSQGSDEGGIGPRDGGATTEFLNKYLWTGTFTVAADAVSGEYVLAYLGFEWELLFDNSKTVTEFQRVYYPITILESAGSSVPATFPKERRDNYGPDDIWDEDSGTWKNPNEVNPSALGGGRYNQQLVVVSDQGKIYFRSLS